MRTVIDSWYDDGIWRWRRFRCDSLLVVPELMVICVICQWTWDDSWGLVVRLVRVDWCVVVSRWHQWGVRHNSRCVVVSDGRLLNEAERLWGSQDWGWRSVVAGNWLRCDVLSGLGSVDWSWEIFCWCSGDEFGWSWSEDLGDGYIGCWFCHDCVETIKSVSSLIMKSKTWLE